MCCYSRKLDIIYDRMIHSDSLHAMQKYGKSAGWLNRNTKIEQTPPGCCFARMQKCQFRPAKLRIDVTFFQHLSTTTHLILR